MNCYNHQAVSAIGICKHCQKALCTECVVDMGHGLACQGVCETEVQALQELMTRSKTAYQKAGRAHIRQAIMLSLLGLIFIFAGIIVDVLSSRLILSTFLVQQEAYCSLVHS